MVIVHALRLLSTFFFYIGCTVSFVYNLIIDACKNMSMKPISRQPERNSKVVTARIN